MGKVKKCFDLQVMVGEGKSYYGKAKVSEYEDGDVELKSYDTVVCRIHKGKFERLWVGYSATTMRHINSFIEFYGIEGGGKSWWNNLEIV